MDKNFNVTIVEMWSTLRSAEKSMAYRQARLCSALLNLQFFEQSEPENDSFLDFARKQCSRLEKEFDEASLAYVLAYTDCVANEWLLKPRKPRA